MLRARGHYPFCETLAVLSGNLYNRVIIGLCRVAIGI